MPQRSRDPVSKPHERERRAHEQEDRTGLQRRPRHRVHSALPPGARLRGRGLRRGRRPAGGLRGRRAARARPRRRRGHGARPQARVRDRLHLPGDRRQCGLREPLPARHRARPPLDRPRPGRSGSRDRRHGGRARRHRKGQRSDPLRVRLRRARGQSRGHLALEGPRVPRSLQRPPGSSRVRRGARARDRRHGVQALQHGREPHALQLRGRHARGSDAGADGRHVPAHPIATRGTR